MNIKKHTPFKRFVIVVIVIITHDIATGRHHWVVV